MGNSWDVLTYCNDDDLKVWLILEDQKIQFSEMDIYQLRVLKKSLSSMNDTLQIEYKNWIKSGDLSRAQLILEKQKINFNNYGEVNFPLPMD